MSNWQLTLDRENFLANVWQRKPLLIKNAIDGFEPALDADELAGLALEEEVESRIIEFRDQNWHLSQGPFTATDFDRAHPWTLLVQAVDHYVPAIADLRKLIDFIPQWRVDDVMVSFAVDGGSVGPHYDNYDVFLLQAQGKRRWKIGQPCDANTALAPNTDLRILQDFHCESEHLLSAGDILYVPPGVAHWGIAEGDCMTFSIGFRAPAIKELLSRSVDSLLEKTTDEKFYTDDPAAPPCRPGEITAKAVTRAKEQLIVALQAHSDDSWFGELVTEPKYDMEPGEEDCQGEQSELLQPGVTLELISSAKLAWQQNEDSVVVFANSESLHHSDAVLPLLISLCEDWRLMGEPLSVAQSSSECAILLEQLLEIGCIELR